MKSIPRPKTADQIRIDRQWDLFGGEYPEHCIASFQKYRPEGIFEEGKEGGADSERLAAARTYHNEILALDDAQLESRWKELQLLKAARREAAHPLNACSANETVYDYYAKAAYWTLDEGVALLLERDPKGLNLGTVKIYRPPPTIGHRFLELSELTRRAAKMKQLAYENNPGFFLAWASRNRLTVPEGLAKAIKGHGIQVADWKSIADQRAKQIVALEAELESLRSQSPTRKRPRSAETIEKQTRLKLIIGLVIASYGHDPQANRTTTASAIRRDLETIGMSMDEDTIRKILGEAAEFAPDTPTD